MAAIFARRIWTSRNSLCPRVCSGRPCRPRPPSRKKQVLTAAARVAGGRTGNRSGAPLAPARPWLDSARRLILLVSDGSCRRAIRRSLATRIMLRPAGRTGETRCHPCRLGGASIDAGFFSRGDRSANWRDTVCRPRLGSAATDVRPRPSGRPCGVLRTLGRDLAAKGGLTRRRFPERRRRWDPASLSDTGCWSRGSPDSLFLAEAGEEKGPVAIVHLHSCRRAAVVGGAREVPRRP